MADLNPALLGVGTVRPFEYGKSINTMAKERADIASTEAGTEQVKAGTTGINLENVQKKRKQDFQDWMKNSTSEFYDQSPDDEGTLNLNPAKFAGAAQKAGYWPEVQPMYTIHLAQEASKIKNADDAQKMVQNTKALINARVSQMPENERAQAYEDMANRGEIVSQRTGFPVGAFKEALGPYVKNEVDASVRAELPVPERDLNNENSKASKAVAAKAQELYPGVTGSAASLAKLPGVSEYVQSLFPSQEQRGASAASATQSLTQATGWKNLANKIDALGPEVRNQDIPVVNLLEKLIRDFGAGDSRVQAVQLMISDAQKAGVSWDPKMSLKALSSYSKTQAQQAVSAAKLNRGQATASTFKDQPQTPQSGYQAPGKAIKMTKNGKVADVPAEDIDEASSKGWVPVGGKK